MYPNHTIIHLWSGPRNISTALMYSFARRADTEVVDEPLYGWYLQQTGLPHPGSDEIIAAMDCNGERVLQNLSLPGSKPVRFIKHMTHHLLNLPRHNLLNSIHILLIRNPYSVIRSYNKVITNPTLDDIGIRQSWELHQYLQQHQTKVLIADGDEILQNPEAQLSSLCRHCNIPMDPRMLHWPAGARPEDGVWAKYWYHRVHQSVGFEPYVPNHEAIPQHLLPLALEANTYYTSLKTAMNNF